MGQQQQHQEHRHGPECGHTQIMHDGHIDYLQDSKLEHLKNDGSVEHHVISISPHNPEICTPKHACQGHKPQHVHGANCGHAAVLHGDHVDYIVEGHLHHPHGDHCDHHGELELVRKN